MRSRPAILLLLALSARSEIHDMLTSAQIDAMFARGQPSITVHERPNYAVVFRVQQGGPGPRETHGNADEIWFVRRGSARVSLGAQRYDVAAGDVVNVPRTTPYQADPGTGRFECVAVQVFPVGDRQPPSLGGILAPRRMPDIVKKAQIDATFATFDRNQPLHSARNFTVNYVIYKGRSGPWEAHRGCVDIYFLHDGAAQAQLGGEIINPKEETPGEIRGAGVSGARSYHIGPGDIVLIPRNTAHHMDPGSGKLGYLLVKVWAE